MHRDRHRGAVWVHCARAAEQPGLRQAQRGRSVVFLLHARLFVLARPVRLALAAMQVPMPRLVQLVRVRVRVRVRCDLRLRQASH